MIWQDPVIALVVFGFTLTTIPIIVHDVKLPLWTAAPMFVGSIILAVCYVTLGLWTSVLVEALAAVLWGYILRRAAT